jgi:hypothetical protein
MNSQEMEQVRRALEAVGGHERVPHELTRAEWQGEELHLGLTLRFKKETPLCCPELACYIGFLGSRRRDLPSSLAHCLERPAAPKVRMTVRTEHEPGYVHRDLRTGEPSWPGTDGVLEYPAEHFSA